MIAIDDYASLALFARVVHHRSFSAAAREAGLAKSAVSRRVARLEELFGVRLLQRSTRRLSVTEEGLRVYEHCAALVAAAGEAEAAIVPFQRGIRGTLRVSAPITFSQLYLAEAIGRFLQAHSEVAVELSAEDRLVDPVEGGFDVAVRIGRLADSNLTAKRLARDRLVVCASPAYLEARGEPATPADLVHHDCLHYALVPRAEEWRFRGVYVPVRGVFSATNGTVLAAAAVAGAGLAVLPSFMVADYLANGKLKLVLEGARRAEIGIYAVTVHKRHAAPRTKAFIDFLGRHFARPPWR